MIRFIFILNDYYNEINVHKEMRTDYSNDLIPKFGTKLPAKAMKSVAP